jgi:hypothetical protein
MCAPILGQSVRKGDELWLIICACYSWEMALNIGLDVSLDNMGLERNTG